MKTRISSILITAALLFGCSGNSTNAPSESAVRQADARRAAAIDNDPKLTPDQKATMKRMMGLGGARPGGR